MHRSPAASQVEHVADQRNSVELSDMHAQQASDASLGIIYGVTLVGLLAPVRWST
jgi:hypothetical protein